MELYVDKVFLDNFYIEYEGRPSQEVLKSILTSYGDKRVFIDFNPDDFEKLKSENEYFALIGNTLPPTPVDSIEKQLFEKSDFSQVLVFMNEPQAWFEEAEKKGALCFTFDNYERRIKEIIDKLHFKIDLSEGFKGWQFLEQFNELPFNNLVITDGYVLSDKDRQKVEDNILPILKLLLGKRTGNLQIDILTKDLNPLSTEAKHIKEKAKKRYELLNRTFANLQAKFQIIMDGIENPFDFHDRIIQTNFSLTDCGKGFNLSQSKPSNSQIISESIFDRYTYNRLNNHRKMQRAYINKLKNLDSLKFKMYP
ncbi:hypothetical protein [Namhaeicola litoreus]|uniref:Uncharacterized protein n=1 Tax=Namhaeicola litoreus TaxID=1052145 RepID=A0ABW3Y0A5_9FLAO